MSAPREPFDAAAMLLREARRLPSMLRRRGVRPEDVADVAGNVLLAAVGALSRFVTPDDGSPLPMFRAWLAAIVRNHVGHYFEARKTREKHRAGLAVMTEARASASPEHEAEVRERLRFASEALASLPELTRTIFYAHDADGATIAALAEEHGISPSVCYRHLARARDALSAALARTEAHDRPRYERRQPKGAAPRAALRERLARALDALEATTQAALRALAALDGA